MDLPTAPLPNHADDPASLPVSLQQVLTVISGAGVSDVHVRAGRPVMVRTNGALQAVGSTLSQQDVSRIVFEALDLAAARDRYLRDGEVDFALTVEGGRYRVNAYRTRGTDAMVLRRVNTTIPALSTLNLPRVLEELTSKPYGLIVISGPTGSGKTTTMAAMIDMINRQRACHILTIEDPIEFLHADQVASVSQREILTDTHDFPSALRAAMRQDPDVILIGEIRDRETMTIALNAAETGHLVLASLHASTVQEAVTRALDFFPLAERDHARAVLASVLQAVVCQRLVPAADGLSRAVVTEIGIATQRLRDAIADPAAGVDVEEVLADGEFYGMHTFEQEVARKILDGTISLTVGESLVARPADLRVLLRRSGYRI